MVVGSLYAAEVALALWLIWSFLTRTFVWGIHTSLLLFMVLAWGVNLGLRKKMDHYDAMMGKEFDKVWAKMSGQGKD